MMGNSTGSCTKKLSMNYRDRESIPPPLLDVGFGFEQPILPSIGTITCSHRNRHVVDLDAASAEVESVFATVAAGFDHGGDCRKIMSRD